MRGRLEERKAVSVVVVSLYRLKRDRWPSLPEKCTAKMSLEGTCSLIYTSVEILVLMSRMDLEIADLVSGCEDG